MSRCLSSSSSCTARTNVFKELTLKDGKITLGTAKIPDIDAISLLKMNTNSIPSKTVPSATISTMDAKTCIKPEYFFPMWFQFSGDTLTKLVPSQTTGFSTWRGAMCQDQGRGKIRTMEGKKKKFKTRYALRLAIGIDQSERVFITRSNRNLDSFISFRLGDARANARERTPTHAIGYYCRIFSLHQ